MANPENEGLVQMIFLCKICDVQVPAVHFPGSISKPP